MTFWCTVFWSVFKLITYHFCIFAGNFEGEHFRKIPKNFTESSLAKKN